MVATRIDFCEPERVEAITAASKRLFLKMQKEPGGSCVWCLCGVVWPTLEHSTITEEWIAKVSLTMAPLSRIGQQEGKSGSLVLIGRFSSADGRNSCRLIVKTREKKEKSGGLEDEWRRARAAKPLTFDRKDSFAIPIGYDDKDAKYDVLWSLYYPTVRESETEPSSERSLPVVSDLRSFLVSEPPATEQRTHAEALKTLDATYAMLRSLHRPSAVAREPAAREERSWGKEYSKYLRRYDEKGNPKSLWGPEWVSVWGPSTSPKVAAGANPIWVLEKLKQMSGSMQLGMVHGDLHPGNVLLRAGEYPAIIDFGWTQRNSHIAKDFVLMECNLRFVFLQPQLADGEIESFVQFLAADSVPTDWTSSYLKERAELILAVRKAAFRAFDAKIDFTREYLIPLFMVAFGLLRFAGQIGCQRAATRFIETLAAHLTKELPLETTG